MGFQSLAAIHVCQKSFSGLAHYVLNASRQEKTQEVAQYPSCFSYCTVSHCFSSACTAPATFGQGFFVVGFVFFQMAMPPSSFP